MRSFRHFAVIVSLAGSSLLAAACIEGDSEPTDEDEELGEAEQAVCVFGVPETADVTGLGLGDQECEAPLGLPPNSGYGIAECSRHVVEYTKTYNLTHTWLMSGNDLPTNQTDCLNTYIEGKVYGYNILGNWTTLATVSPTQASWSSAIGCRLGVDGSVGSGYSKIRVSSRVYNGPTGNNGALCTYMY